MKIVLKWNMKSLTADLPRLVLTVLSIAGAFAMLTAMGLSVDSYMAAIGSINGQDSLPQIILSLLRPLTLIVFAFSLYVLFSVSLAERKNQYFIMRSAGTTTRQLVNGLLAEAAVLDAVGGVFGIGLGFLVAWLQLRYSGVPLRIQVFFSAPLLGFSLFLAFLLPPLMMLAASPRLLWQKRVTRRKKPSKGGNDPFKRRYAGARLFGAGGVLESTLGRQQRRHQLLLVAAIVANFAVLFLVTTGVSLLSDMATFIHCDMEMSFFSSASTDKQYAADSEGLREGIGEVLESCKKDGLLQSFEHMRRYGEYVTVMEDDEISEEVCAAFKGNQSDGYSSLYRLKERRYVSATSFLYCFDDDMFDLFLEDNQASYAGSGSLLVNDCFVGGKYMSLMKEDPGKSVVLYRESNEIWDLRTEANEAGSLILPDRADALLRGDGQGVNIPIGGLLQVRLDSLYEKYKLILPSGSVILPERLLSRYENALTAVDQTCLDTFFIQSADTQAVYRRLSEALDQTYGYTFRRKILGDGNAFYRPTAQTEEETVRLRLTDVEVNDYQTQQSDYRTFYQQLLLLYRFFASMLFLMIGLNIINVVHMNRISRRQEYAVLTSIGLSARQKMGMLLYESFRLTMRIVVVGFLVMVPLADVAYYLFGNNGGFSAETMLPESIITYNGDFSLVKEAKTVAENLWLYISPRWYLVVFSILFLFGGLLLAEYAAWRQLEKDELVLILKDDIHE